MIVIQHNGRQWQRGLSLVELMVAITLGIFLTFGVIQAFLSGKQAYGMQQALARIQENARLAQEFIGNDIRNAGDYGCASGDDFMIFGAGSRQAGIISGDNNNMSCAHPVGLNSGGTVGINMLANNTLLADYEKAVYGFDNVTSTTAFGYTLNPAPIAGTDVLLVRTAMDVGNLSGAFSNQSNGAWTVTIGQARQTISVNGANALVAGEVVSISDCNTMKIFMIGGTTPVSTGASNVFIDGANNYCTVVPVITATHPSSYIAPPNVSDYFPQTTQQFAAGATVKKLVNTYYYVALNPDGVSSLYRQRVVNVGTPTSNPVAEELLEGVQDMQLQFGIESTTITSANTANAMIPTTYVDPSAVTVPQWNVWDAGFCQSGYPTPSSTCFANADASRDMYQTVRSVRYSLLLSDQSQKVLGSVAGGTSQSYTFPAWSTTVTTTNDGYLRQVIVNTVGIRPRVNVP